MSLGTPWGRHRLRLVPVGPRESKRIRLNVNHLDVALIDVRNLHDDPAVDGRLLGQFDLVGSGPAVLRYQVVGRAVVADDDRVPFGAVGCAGRRRQRAAP